MERRRGCVQQLEINSGEVVEFTSASGVHCANIKLDDDDGRRSMPPYYDDTFCFDAAMTPNFFHNYGALGDEKICYFRKLL